jgi:chromosomal replication initiator protein
MPDYETRLAILKKKVEQENIIIEDFILHTIAENINSNIRELEGTLNKIVAYAQLTHSPITIEMAQKAIDDMMIQKRKVLSSEFIQEVVAKYFNIDKSDLISAKKSNDIAYPRQIAMYLCRSEAKLSYPKIGQDFGNRDHSTVMYACEKIEKEVKENSKTKLIVESVKKLIQENA